MNLKLSDQGLKRAALLLGMKDQQLDSQRVVITQGQGAFHLDYIGYTDNPEAISGFVTKRITKQQLTSIKNAQEVSE